MDYLLIKLFPYLLVALAFGLFVGWTSCSSARD